MIYHPMPWPTVRTFFFLHPVQDRVIETFEAAKLKEKKFISIPCP